MTIYARPDELVFAESANPGEVVAFPDILRGWGLTFEQTEGKPPMEWMNAILKRQDEAIRYLLQRGIAEWSETEDYPVGAYVQHGDVSYKALQANSQVEPGTSALTWSDVAPKASTTTKGLIRIATTVLAQALTDDETALTPKKLADAFGGAASSLDDTGCERMPSGRIMQWGSVVVASNAASGTALFPLTFPLKCFHAISARANFAGANIADISATSVSAADITIYPQGTSATARTFRYIAVGV